MSRLRGPNYRQPAVIFLLVCIGILAAGFGCSRRIVPLSQAASVAPKDNSYIDLAPQWGLSIIMPLFKSGGTLPTLTAQQSKGNTISYSAPDLIGYQTAYYEAAGTRSGAVRLKFWSAAITKDGKTVVQLKPPTLPFPLPKGPQYIRLVYFVRVSQADHNMAIVASKHLETLNTFTRELETNPDRCSQSGNVFCSWVPPGVAVRPEAAKQ